MQYNRLLTSLCARANIKKSSTHSWQQYCEFSNLHHKLSFGNCLQKALIIKSAEQQIVNVEIVETKMTNSKKYVFIEQQRKGQRHWLVRASFRPLSGEAWDGEEDEERGWQRTVDLCNPKVWVTTVNVSAFQEDKRTNKESGNHSYYTWAELLHYCKEETKKEDKTGFRTHSRTVRQTGCESFSKGR